MNWLVTLTGILVGTATLAYAVHLGASVVYEQAGGVNVPTADCDGFKKNNRKPFGRSKGFLMVFGSVVRLLYSFSVCISKKYPLAALFSIPLIFCKLAEVKKHSPCVNSGTSGSLNFSRKPFYKKEVMKENERIIGLSFLLGIIGFLTWDFFLSYSMTAITGENILFDKSGKLPDQSFPLAVFIFSFGIIPFLYLLVKKVCKLTTPTSQYISIVLIITSGLLFCALRILYLKIKAAKIHDLLQRAEFAEGAEIPGIRFEEVNLEVYLLMGLIAGTLLSILMYRKKASRKN